jgi:hypothetical protein
LQDLTPPPIRLHDKEQLLENAKTLLAEEPEREVRRQPLFQELNRLVLRYPNLGGQDQGAGRSRARLQEQPKPAAKQALCFTRGQQFEVRRSHRIG